MLAAINIGKALLKAKRLPDEFLIDLENAPITTIRIANHWEIERSSPKKGMASKDTNTGNVLMTADAREASSSL